MWTHILGAPEPKQQGAAHGWPAARAARSPGTQRHSGGMPRIWWSGVAHGRAAPPQRQGLAPAARSVSTQLGTATPITTRRAGRAGHGAERGLPASAAAGANWCCSMTGPPEPTVPAGPWCRRRHRDDAHENDRRPGHGARHHGRADQGGREVGGLGARLQRTCRVYQHNTASVYLRAPPYAAVSPTSYSVSSDQTNASSPVREGVVVLRATGGAMSERSARRDELSEAFARVQAAARHGPWHSARQQDWTSILSTHPDLIDLDLHAATWYPDA
jgi:hypothetical protein